MSEIVRLVVAILVPQAVGIAGALVTAPAVRAWYATLELPGWRPPDWVFGPVWTLLYVLMGVASYLVWREASTDPAARAALWAYAIQLAFNLAWSFLFFGLRSPLAGLVDIALLWTTILVTTALFFGVRTAAGWLMVPYLAWVTYAGVLNFAIWRMN